MFGQVKLILNLVNLSVWNWNSIKIRFCIFQDLDLAFYVNLFIEFSICFDVDIYLK